MRHLTGASSPRALNRGKYPKEHFDLLDRADVPDPRFYSSPEARTSGYSRLRILGTNRLCFQCCKPGRRERLGVIGLVCVSSASPTSHLLGA